MNLLDRAIMWFAPTWGKQRVQARMLARHFEAASVGRRTSGWSRMHTDANAAAGGATLSFLRAQARDLVRNDPWARRGLRRIAADAVGCGIRPKALGRGAATVMDRWRTWAETTECDAAGRLTFYGLQRLAMSSIARDGEVLIRRRFRLPTDGLSVPLQLQMLEADLIDTGKQQSLPNGGEIIQGVELDAIGRRVAYWLFDKHPGGLGQLVSPMSRRIPADSILHVFDQERAGQLRGPSWFASVDVRLHDFAEFEGATLDKAKIAACMAVFVTDQGDGGTVGFPGGTDTRSSAPIDTFEPGMVIPLPPGKQVTVANPPTSTDHQSYSATVLRGVAAGIGTTYADLTGDYSQANYSSERASRLAHQGDVESWQEHMLIPQMCAPAWKWMIQAMIIAGADVEDAPAEWTCQPMPILDPEKEADATVKEIRGGLTSWAKAVRARGYDPDELIKEIITYNKKIDAGKVVLDSDPRVTDSAGAKQMTAPGAHDASPEQAPPPKADAAASAESDAAPATTVPKAPVAAKPKATTQEKPAEVKVFSYHQPFMKVKEIRENIGLSGDVEDGELFALEFLEEHGGAGKDGTDSTGAETGANGAAH